MRECHTWGLAEGDWQLIVLTDTIQTWGYSATVHYSHAARSVVAQSALALHTEFNANVGPNPLYRSYGLLRTAVIGGTKVTVNGTDAKSLLGIMSLGLTKGATVDIASDDPDGGDAVEAIAALAESGFGEH